MLTSVLLLLLLPATLATASATEGCISDTPTDAKQLHISSEADTLIPTLNDSAALLGTNPARAWTAAAEVVAINAGILTFDRFALNQDFAHVTLQTVKRNAKLSHWFWDNDKMYTNLMSHPYHGNLYYNAARSNGLSFAASSLYSIAGSLMWEIGGESELLSVNDILSTPVGGIALGETTHRLADLITDDTQTGPRRFLSEAAVMLINPVRGFNRLLHGESWRRHSTRTTFVPEHLVIDVAAGLRHLHTSGRSRSGINTAYVGMDIEYGSAVAKPADTKPYSYFLLSSLIAVGGHQPIVNRMSLVGRLLSSRFSRGRGGMEVGMYQHFNYLQTHKTHDGDIPYMIAETFSVGLGMQHATSFGKGLKLRGGLYANAMALGGIMSEVEHEMIVRNYNMGSGYTLRCNTVAELGRWLRVRTQAEYYRLYTWIDCSSINFDRPPADWGAQGDKGVSGMLVFNIAANLHISKRIALSLGASFFNRHSHYGLHPALSPSHSHTWEWRLGMSLGL